MSLLMKLKGWVISDTCIYFYCSAESTCNKADVESIFTPLSIFFFVYCIKHRLTEMLVIFKNLSKCPLKTQSKLQKCLSYNCKAFVYDLKVELKIPVLDLNECDKR